jgi:hypothetical protein
MEIFIIHFTTLPTLIFFTIWIILGSLLLCSILVGLDMDLGLDIDASTTIVPDFMISKGVTKIPLSLSLFIVFSFGLMLSSLLQSIIIPSVGLDLFQGELTIFENFLGVVLFFPIFISSLYLSSPILTFLGKHIQNPENTAPIDFIGMECKITTGIVSANFGEALVTDENKKYIIHVKSDDNLVRDDIAVIIADKDDNGDYTIKKL